MDTWIGEIQKALWAIAGNDPVRLILLLIIIGGAAISYFLLRLSWQQWQKAVSEIDRLHKETYEELRTLKATLIEIRVRRESQRRERE